MKAIKYTILLVTISLVFCITEPQDPCTNFQNPTSFLDCNKTSTIYPNSICCFLSSTKNGQTYNACFPSYYGSSRSYSANGIEATFRCSGYFQKFSLVIIVGYLLSIIIF